MPLLVGLLLPPAKSCAVGVAADDCAALALPLASEADCSGLGAVLKEGDEVPVPAPAGEAVGAVVLLPVALLLLETAALRVGSAMLGVALSVPPALPLPFALSVEGKEALAECEKLALGVAEGVAEGVALPMGLLLEVELPSAAVGLRAPEVLCPALALRLGEVVGLCDALLVAVAAHRGEGLAVRDSAEEAEAGALRALL